VEEQNEKVDKATQDVETVVREMREGEAKTRDEMREIRDEVSNIQEMLPKVLFWTMLQGLHVSDL
jgi:peroxin-14